MLVITNARPSVLARIDRILVENGLTHTRHPGPDRCVFAVDGHAGTATVTRLAATPGVIDVLTAPGDQWLSARRVRPRTTRVDVGFGVEVGGDAFVVAAGPCAVESQAVLNDITSVVALGGASILRGGAFKPRSHPASFQGLGAEGLALLARQREITAIPVVTEVLDPRHVAAVAESADILQIGARNMHNFELLKEAGRSGRPVLLKRGLAATVDEWFGAAEYVLRTGNPHVILCERGIRTFEPATRFTLDLGAVAVAKRRGHLPVLVDPSHATGRRELVRPLALAAAAAGADGLLLDVHTAPETARCDGAQALTATDFDRLMADLRPLLRALGRPLASDTRVLAEGNPT
ncbi:3-deoxy-7-phosphoheptulonate synthase [Marinitenerispora sediminis]|uniref:3-deoxy-7-phosphoheptulonate synthase n=1 Tax=Marinitenerispora sediminis TaxID=1931232 RepID=UPI0015F14245|nr:3-deoxy-7-phosphoheptulonate synthase [Marinitenerispora sediminis]